MAVRPWGGTRRAGSGGEVTVVNGVVLVGNTGKVTSEQRLEESLERDGPGGEGQGVRGLQQLRDAAPSG